MYCTYNIGIDRARIDEMHSIEAGFRTECVADPINHGILDVLKLGVSSTHMHKFDRSFLKGNMFVLFSLLFLFWFVDIYWFMKNLIKHHSVHYWMRCGFGFGIWDLL